ncbi:MAG: cysteine desulfurase [Vallitaleaceae bacterium]|nr:cysteine desulfurase [Vallitaleaceae bacterium]
MINHLPPLTDSYYFLNGIAPQLPYDVYSVRKDFPILEQKIGGKPLIWLDNAATTQKPNQMIDALSAYYRTYNSNIHRGAHTLARLATNGYENAREIVREFIGAASSEEIIFVRGATEGINLVAESFGDMIIKDGDEILLSTMEHHSNIVPWQRFIEKGAHIKAIPINDQGEIILDAYKKLLNHKTKIVAITQVSNILGTINPLEEMIRLAHLHGAYVLVDGAQGIAHQRVNVQSLDTDFYVFSGHKIYGPTGIGVVYGKKVLLEKMPVWQRGGGMIEHVDWDASTYNQLPYKFEAGTGNIADAIGLGDSIKYVQKIGLQNIEAYEKELTRYTMNGLNQIPGVILLGTANHKTSVISFLLNGMTPEDVAKRLDEVGIAVRAGHHCAQPTLKRFGLKSCVRASLGMYNTNEEVDCLISSIRKINRSS